MFFLLSLSVQRQVFLGSALDEKTLPENARKSAKGGHDI